MISCFMEMEKKEFAFSVVNSIRLITDKLLGEILAPLIAESDLSSFLPEKHFAYFRHEYKTGLNSLIKVLLPDERPSTQTASVVSDLLSGEARQRFDELPSMLQTILDRLVSGDGKLPPPVFSKPGAGKDDNLCFVLMPFEDEDLQIVYKDFVKPAIQDKCGLICRRADDIFGPNIIMDDVCKALRKARLIIAELTGGNPNVFYEVGLCHAIGKDVLLLSQSIKDIPFDLRHRRVIPYDYTPHGCRELEKFLCKTVKYMLGDK